ncbi:myb-related transcription factor, partner of profilin-like [Apus apus]|uniref:myb-related transcription factor, partner of profilin-like n=1 Tax=Apus apus TaxID=8895 RepID=UPI0021F8A87F|nr:myb-related transcription factor, partner of profilin-like [Apus apus]
MLFGRETMHLSHADGDKIWEGIARQISSVSQVPSSVKDIKHRWDNKKRRTKDKLAFMQKSLASPDSPGQPATIVLAAQERAIESTLHSSHQMHGFQTADVDVVDSLSASSDEDEEMPGTSREHCFSSLQRASAGVSQLSGSSFLRSSSSSEHSEATSQRQELHHPSPHTTSSCRPPHKESAPLQLQSPASSFPRTANRPVQAVLVAIHRDMADSMHVISPRMADLTSQVGQMCQTLSEICDGVQAFHRIQESSVMQGCLLQAACSEQPPEFSAES